MHGASRCLQRKKQLEEASGGTKTQDASSSGSGSNPTSITMPDDPVAPLQEPVNPSTPAPAANARENRPIDPILEKIFAAQRDGDSDPGNNFRFEDNEKDSPSKELDLEFDNDEDEVNRDEEDDGHEKDPPAASNNDKVAATIQLPPVSRSVLDRLAKVRQVNEIEIKRKRSTAYIWDDKKTFGEILQKEKKLAVDFEELGAMTGCYGFFCLSKCAVSLAILI